MPRRLLPRSSSLGLAALLALGAGCVTVRYREGNTIADERIARIQPGVTRKSEILDWFGAPQTFNQPSMLQEFMEDASFTPAETLTLPFQDVMAYQFSVGLVEGIVTGVYNDVDVRVVSDRLVIFFDSNDVVLYYGYRKGTDALLEAKKSGS
jgi:hypothetical protein